MDFKYQKIERYSPYTKTANDEAMIRLSTSGHIAVNQKAYDDWIKPRRKVDLFFITGGSGRAIGIKPLETNEGLSVIENEKSKSKYISARGFIRQYKISTNESPRLKCFFDDKEKMIIAPLDFPSPPKATSNEIDASIKSVSNGDDQDLKKVILQIVPTTKSGKEPLSVPDIMEKVADKLGLRLKARSSSKRRAFRAKVNYCVNSLKSEGKLVDSKKEPWRRKSGTWQTFYYGAEYSA